VEREGRESLLMKEWRDAKEEPGLKRVELEARQQQGSEKLRENRASLGNQDEGARI